MLCGSLVGRGVWGRVDPCMAKSFLCSAETVTTLLISYTLIQNKTLKKENLVLAQQPMGELSTACDALHFPPSMDCFPLNKGQQACC